MKTTFALLFTFAIAGCAQQEGDLTDTGTAEQDTTSCQTTIDLRPLSGTQIIDADENNGANCSVYQVTALTGARQWQVHTIWYGEPLDNNQTACENAVLAANLKVQTSTGWTSLGSSVDRGVWKFSGYYGIGGPIYDCDDPEVVFDFGSNHTFLLTADARDVGTLQYQGMQFVIEPL